MRHHRVARPRHRFRDAPAATGELTSEWMGPWRKISSAALLDILAGAGCPICLLTQRAIDAVVAGILQAPRLPELTDREARRARGFCGAHAWALAGEATLPAIPARALSRSLAHVLTDALAALASYGESEPDLRLDPMIFKRTVHHAWTKKIARRLAPVGSCPLCLVSKRTQEILGYQVLELLRQDQVRAVYGPQSALCRPHFRWALDAAAEKKVLDRLVSIQRTRLQALVANHDQLDVQSALAHVVGARFGVRGI